MDFKPLIQWLQNQIKTGFFWSRIENPKDISDPIVKAIRDKEYDTLDPTSVSEPIVGAIEDATRAIESIKIPEVNIPETDFSEVVSTLKELLKKDTNVTVKQGDTKVTVDTKSLLAILKKIEAKKPQEQIDYTPILSDLCDLIEGMDRTVDLSRIEKFLNEFKLPELPIEDGRVKVTIPDEELAKMRSKLFTSEHLRNTSNVQINPATEDKQDSLLTELQKKADLTETQPVSAASLPLPSGAATSEKQDEIIAELQDLSAELGTPTTTNVTLTNADTDYKLPSSEKEGRRSIIVSNNSAYDVYLGQTGVIDCDATPPIGILLPAGGSITLDCSTGLYAQCDTAGVKLTVTEF